MWKMGCLSFIFILTYALLAFHQEIQAFKWDVDERYFDEQLFSFSERYMYGSDKGPLGSRGSSMISVDFDVTVEGPLFQALNLSVLFYASNEEAASIKYNFCNGLPKPGSTLPAQSDSDSGPTTKDLPITIPGPKGQHKITHLHLFQPLKQLKLMVDDAEFHTITLVPHDLDEQPGQRWMLNDGGEEPAEDETSSDETAGNTPEDESNDDGEDSGEGNAPEDDLEVESNQDEESTRQPTAPGTESKAPTSDKVATEVPTDAPIVIEHGKSNDPSSIDLDNFGNSNEPQIVRYEGKIRATYEVKSTNFNYALFSLCPRHRPSPYTELKGTVSFKNPYGYLPAMYFGFLPWSGIRLCLFLIFDAIFFYLVYKYSDRLLTVHKAIAVVLFIATFEAASWFAAYEILNVTGKPFCCPFPASVVTATIAENLRKTTSRALLLMLCLGWGVVFPTLPRKKILQVSGITIAYMFSGFLFQITQIIAASRVKEGGLATHETIFTLPFLVCDILFIMLIYFALVEILDVLKAKNETVKLDMYTRLGKVLAGFVGAFSLLTLIYALCQFFQLYFPWQFLWMEQASWDILNFAVLVTVCIIWRPSDRSQLLAYHSQLPTVDADEDGGMQMSVIGADGDKDQVANINTSTMVEDEDYTVLE